MNMEKAETAIKNGVFAAIFWLILDWALILSANKDIGGKDVLSQPYLYVGAAIVIACIVGLHFKSRLAAVALLLFFLLPQIVRIVQGSYPSPMLFLVTLMFLYYFVAAVIGVFSYHELKTRVAVDSQSEK